MENVNISNLKKLHVKYKNLLEKINDVRSCALYEFKSRYTTFSESVESEIYEEYVNQLFDSKNEKEFDLLIKKFNATLSVKPQLSDVNIDSIKNEFDQLILYMKELEEKIKKLEK